MTGPDDIEAFSGDLEIADRIVERTKKGVKPGREMMAEEVRPFIRAYVIMRSQLEAASKFFAEQKERELQGMSVGEKRPD